MEITNNHNLPPAILKAVSYDARPPKINRFSVTDLIGPPQIRQLKIKHWEELQQDASDMLWMLLGKACHYVLEKSAPAESLPEIKNELEFEGNTIVGIQDLYHNEEIHDYKITSAYSFILGDKPEWAAQLNLLAFILTKQGYPVKALKIYAILRDWTRGKSLQDASYPRIPFQEVEIPLWSTEGQERYLRARLEAHKAESSICSDEERWMKTTTYAVIKDGNKRALRVFDKAEEASIFLTMQKGNYHIEERKGEYTRCNAYCAVSNFCQQNNQAKTGLEAV